MIVSQDYRSDILRFASAVTKDREDPIAVRANALPMLQWLEAATDDEDQRARWRALWRQHHNAGPEQQTTTPARFLAAAEQYYAFLTA